MKVNVSSAVPSLNANFRLEHPEIGRLAFSVPLAAAPPYPAASACLAPLFTPQYKEVAVEGVNLSDIPKNLNELGELLSYSYDLSIKRAGELNIPVIGGEVSGSLDRRVVVLEWTRYKSLLDSARKEFRYGYAIRFCLTVDKWQAAGQVRLPFLAAQAEMGNIKAQWLMQIRGLSGPKIDAVVLPPQELNVSTFVLAKQSLESAINAVNDQTTQFISGTLLATIDPTKPETEYWLAVIRTFALSGVLRGKTQSEVIGKLQGTDFKAHDTVAEIYNYLGVTDPNAKPSPNACERAKQILHGITFKVG